MAAGRPREPNGETNMRIGTTVGLRGDPEDLAAWVRELEAAGVEFLWTGEAYTADAVSTMGFLSAVTRRAAIGSAILPLYTRTPALLAMTAVGLDRLTKGRFVLGLGASGPQVIEGFHGIAYDAPLARTREIVDICRAVWRQDRLVHAGPHYPIPLPAGFGTGLGKALRIADRPVRPDVPVYLASLGPRNVAMTAEIAEGWIPLHFWPERAGAIWGPALAEGARRRLPGLAPLEVVAGGPLAIGSGLEHLRDRARPMLALYFGGMGARGMNFYNDLLCRYGFESEAAAIQDAYLSGDRKRAAALVPQELIDATSLIGDPGFVRDRIDAYREAGVTVLNVQPVGENGLRDLATLSGWLA